LNFQLNRNQKNYVNFLVHIIGDRADDVNILGSSVHTIKKKAEVLAVAIKEIGLEVNAEKLSTWSCLDIKMQDEVTM